MNIRNFTYIFFSIFLVFYLLYIGKSIFIPLAVALVLWYIIIALASAYKNLKVMDFNIPSPIALVASVLSLFTVFFIFMSLVNSNIGNVIRLAPDYQQKFSKISYDFLGLIGADQSLGLNELVRSIDMSNFLLNITGLFTSLTGYLTLILVFTIFIFLEYRIFHQKLRKIFSSEEKYRQFSLTMQNIDKDIKTYLKIKTLASFFTGLLSFLVLYLVGVDLAVFWGLLIFVLNYIPTIGSIIAVFFPIVISLVQFDSFIPFLIVTIFLISIQLIIGNIIEPKYMGKSLNLSPLVIIFSLAIWGSIWGVVGMFLCVPIMAIINIIFAKFDNTRPIAVILSATGKIN